MSLKAITHAHLIDGNGGEPLADATILVRDQAIEAVGEGLAIPAEAEVIDAAGRTVMPGLVEGHAHVGGNTDAIQVLRLSLQRGITTVCSVSANRDGIRLRDGINAGQVRGCSRMIAGAVVCPTHGHVKFRTADGPWEVRKAVREMTDMGADFIKTAASGGFWAANETCSVRNYTLEELEALVDEAHAWEVPVVVHAHTQPGIGNSIKAGVDQIHHGCFIDEAGVRGIKDAGLYFVPTLRVTSDRNLAAWPDRPWMLEEMRKSQPIHRAGVRLAHEIGANIAVGTDYPGSGKGWLVGDATPWELVELQDCGLSPMEVLVAATRTTAQAYRKLDLFGTLDPGKFADLLIVDGNPLDDLWVLYDETKIALVMKEGAVEHVTDLYRDHYRIGIDQPANRFRVPGYE